MQNARASCVNTALSAFCSTHLKEFHYRIGVLRHPTDTVVCVGKYLKEGGSVVRPAHSRPAHRPAPLGLALARRTRASKD